MAMNQEWANSLFWISCVTVALPVAQTGPLTDSYSGLYVPDLRGRKRTYNNNNNNNSLYSLVHEGFQWRCSGMSNLSCDATTPLHKLDIVQVVLHAPRLRKAKAGESCVSCPINVLLLFNNLQKVGQSWLATCEHAAA